VQVFINFANSYKRFVHAFFKASADLIFLLKKSGKKKVQNQINHDLRDEKIHEVDKKNLYKRVDITSL
jgi:UTP-glucose-1-phosphate uridylyltransferase